MDRTDDIIRYSDVLIALRRIIRATDLHAKRLAKETGLTPPQLLILQTLDRSGNTTIGEVAAARNLTQATVTTIVDRMERRGLVVRQRNQQDKRKVNIVLTEEGQKILDDAPTILQDRLAEKFAKLKDWEQSYILSALQRVATIMDAEEIDASPVLDLGAIDRMGTGNS